MDVYLGMIFPWAVPWCPVGFAFCDGSLLSLMQYQALFSLLGTTYGGDGQSTFGLPDLRCRLPLGRNNGGAVPNLTTRSLGNKDGAENEQLTLGNMPTHTHAVTGQASISGLSLNGSPNVGMTTDPNGNYIANASFPATPDNAYGPYTLQTFVPAAQAGTVAPIAGLSGSVNLAGIQTQASGGGQPYSTMPPFTVINYIIATQGLYPQRQ